jgi:predicted ATPase
VDQAPKRVALLERGLSQHRVTGGLISTPFALIMLAEAHSRCGQRLQASDCLAEAAEIIEKTDERYSEVELHRLQGELLHASGDSSGAEECYFRAVDVARRQSAKAFELRASISLARLWLEQVKRTEARDLLAPIYGWFTEGFDTPHLKEAKALLAKLAT